MRRTETATLLNEGGGIKGLLGRQAKAARLLASGEFTQQQVAEACGYHPGYMPILKKNPAVAQKLGDLEERLDDAVVDMSTRLRAGAEEGLKLLTRILDKRTEEGAEADLKLKVNVASQLLDREGSFPKTTRKQTSGAQFNVTLGPDEIAEMKARQAKVVDAI